MIERKSIIENLAALDRLVIEPGQHKLAAVALVLAPCGGELSYILTRRAANMRRNAGNFALPGGAVDFEDEDVIATAIRETREELGVLLERSQVVGLLDDFVTLTGHHVTPVVFWCDFEPLLKPDPCEVGSAWFVPLTDLMQEDSTRLHEKEDGREPILQVRMQDNWINPPTAAWLYQFREVALRGNIVRVHELRMPGWTAR